jgi:hypothetical protein
LHLSGRKRNALLQRLDERDQHGGSVALRISAVEREVFRRNLPKQRFQPAHRPQEPGFPEHCGAGSSCAPPDAKTDSFFSNSLDPQCGHLAPDQSLVRTSISLSFLHSEQ